MTHEILTKLDNLNLDNLKTLMDSVNYSDKPIRLGSGGIEKRSVYTFSKWKSWNKDQRNLFKNSLPTNQIQLSVIGWFLKFPKDTGFLDEMNYWVDMKGCGTILAYALNDNQTINIAGNNVTLNAGDGVKFNLTQLHHIDKSASGQNWACLMQLI